MRAIKVLLVLSAVFLVDACVRLNVLTVSEGERVRIDERGTMLGYAVLVAVIVGLGAAVRDARRRTAAPWWPRAWLVGPRRGGCSEEGHGDREHRTRNASAS